MRSSTPRRHRLFGALLVGTLALAPAALVGADTPPEPTISEDELADLVALVLAELGLPADASGPIVDDVLAGVTARLNELVDQGIVDPDEVDALAEVVEDGDFDDIVPAIVEETRERRDAFREAAETVLTALGVDVPEDGSLKDAIEDAGLTREDLADLFEESGIELPEPPARPDRDECDPTTGEGCPEPPVEQAPARPAPTTTQAPAPTPEPEPAPPTPPAPDYPEAAPRPPASDYPSRGGDENQPAPPPPRPEYPTTESGEPGTDPEESV